MSQLSVLLIIIMFILLLILAVVLIIVHRMKKNQMRKEKKEAAKRKKKLSRAASRPAPAANTQSSSYFSNTRLELLRHLEFQERLELAEEAPDVGARDLRLQRDSLLNLEIPATAAEGHHALGSASSGR